MIVGLWDVPMLESWLTAQNFFQSCQVKTLDTIMQLLAQ